MSEARKLWTKDELILALNLYLKLPLENCIQVRLKSFIWRTFSAECASIAMRLNNFASVDPYHRQRGIGGLPGGKKQVEPIWKEFINNKESLLFESERILAGLEHTSIERKFFDELKGTEHLKGEYKLREVKIRVNQMCSGK